MENLRVINGVRRLDPLQRFAYYIDVRHLRLHFRATDFQRSVALFKAAMFTNIACVTDVLPKKVFAVDRAISAHLVFLQRVGRYHQGLL